MTANRSVTRSISPDTDTNPRDPPPDSRPPVYAQVPQMGPYEPIPAPSPGAQASASQGYKDVMESAPSIVEAFEARFHAWRQTWYSPQNGPNARDRCDVAEFDSLLELGPRVLPLVVYHLLNRHNFTAVYLYNGLEADKKYRIDPSDVLNYLVLQRQNSLIIEINAGRKW